jgi:hypothetical protein
MHPHLGDMQADAPAKRDERSRAQAVLEGVAIALGSTAPIFHAEHWLSRFIQIVVSTRFLP